MNARADYPLLPLSDGLCCFIDTRPEFLASLKLSNPARFACLPLFVVSSIPRRSHGQGDSVIGIWYLDKENLARGLPPFFKQDFIVDVGSCGVDFVSYSAWRDVGMCVRPLREFFKKYGEDGKYYSRQHPSKAWEHHYDDVEDLPPPLRSIGFQVKLRYSKADGVS